MALAAGIAGLFFLPAPWNVVAVVAAALVEVGEVFLWMRYLGRIRVSTGAEGLIGARVEVLEACNPAGRAKLRGEIWTAVAADAARPIAAGEPARVIAVDGLSLRLEPQRLTSD